MSSPVYSEQRLLLGHPAACNIAFVSETWERFSYYGMKALLSST
jgi:dipeptide/tripeptide permease